MGPARAKEMIILGRKYTGKQLHEIGYVNEVVDNTNLIIAAENLSAEICHVFWEVSLQLGHG